MSEQASHSPTESAAIILEGRGITRAYADKTSGESLKVLRGIDIEIPENSFVSIVGSSGSGKSTLLHLLGGLDYPTSGTVLYKGTELSALNQSELAAFRNKNLGFIFQFHHLLPEFSALENVFMPGMIAGGTYKQLRDKAGDLLTRFGLGNRLEHRPSELSGGEQQRVAVARALMNQPDVLLADEPTGNLDEANTESLLQILFDLKNEKAFSLVMVTHDKQIAKTADYSYQIEGGKIHRDQKV
jgi:lipoprotein-releasing system ATP-binding protein